MNRALRTVVCSLTLIAAQAAAATFYRANVWAQDSPPPSEISADAAPAPAPEKPADAAPAPVPEKPADAAPAPAPVPENSADAAPAPESEKPADAAPAPAPSEPADAAPASAPVPENSADAAPAPESEKPADTAPAPVPENSAEAAPAPEPEKPADAAPAPDAILALERSAREKAPELFEKLTIVRKFAARLPNYWRVAKPTKKQTREIYALQKDYFDEISRLEARIARLESERDARMRAILTDDQRQALDAKLAEVEKTRAEKKNDKNGDGDAEE